MMNAVVLHKDLGRGVISQISDDNTRITVDFKDKTTKFQCPEAFKHFLTAEDPEVQKKMMQKVAEKEIEEKEKEKRKVQRYVPPVVTKNKSSHKNIIFKFNYCDGGASKNSLGYNDVCSPKMIRYNIETVRRTWCSDDGCDCKKYLDGYISYAELCSYMDDGGSVCNESRLLRDWGANMGWDLTTPNGKPRKLPDYVSKHSLCILTTREPDSTESQRIVFGVYMVSEFEEGDDNNAGGVNADSDYKLALSPVEARKILLWNYYANKKNPGNPRWGSGLTRSLDDNNALALLADIKKVKNDAKEKTQAQRILERFCELNKLDATNIPEASGALSL